MKWLQEQAGWRVYLSAGACPCQGELPSEYVMPDLSILLVQLDQIGT